MWDLFFCGLAFVVAMVYLTDAWYIGTKQKVESPLFVVWDKLIIVAFVLPAAYKLFLEM
jgi:hypothetical protein